VQGLRHGWYKIIQSLVRVLSDGPNVKRLVDRIIDQSGTNAQASEQQCTGQWAVGLIQCHWCMWFLSLFSCGTFQNLREVVYETQVLCQTCLPRKRPFFIRRGENYLIRYFMLLAIGAYMSQEVAHAFTRLTFQQWLADRPEVTNILAQMQFPEEPPAAAASLRLAVSSARRTGSMGGSSGMASPMAAALNAKAAQAK